MSNDSVENNTLKEKSVENEQIIKNKITCKGTTENGKPCKNIPMKDSQYCNAHIKNDKEYKFFKIFAISELILIVISFGIIIFSWLFPSMDKIKNFLRINNIFFIIFILIIFLTAIYSLLKISRISKKKKFYEYSTISVLIIIFSFVMTIYIANIFITENYSRHIPLNEFSKLNYEKIPTINIMCKSLLHIKAVKGDTLYCSVKIENFNSEIYSISDFSFNINNNNVYNNSQIQSNFLFPIRLPDKDQIEIKVDAVIKNSEEFNQKNLERGIYFQVSDKFSLNLVTEEYADSIKEDRRKQILSLILFSLPASFFAILSGMNNLREIIENDKK